MKYTQTLIVNAQELRLLREGMKLLVAELNKQKEQDAWISGNDKSTLHKAINMELVLTDSILGHRKDISESSIYKHRKNQYETKNIN